MSKITLSDVECPDVFVEMNDGTMEELAMQWLNSEVNEVAYETLLSNGTKFIVHRDRGAVQVEVEYHVVPTIVSSRPVKAKKPKLED